jgi:predicted transcriptional regulator
MARRKNTMSIYIPQDKVAGRVIERLSRVADRKDRSVNYVIVEAILEYLDRAEVPRD